MKPTPPNDDRCLKATGETTGSDEFAAAIGDGGLRVVGCELSTDGLEHVALLLLRIGRSNRRNAKDGSPAQ